MERRIYSEQDIQQVNQAEQQLRARGLDEPVERIVDVLDGYFQANRSPVTVEIVVKLIEAQPGLKWLTPAELEYHRVAAENPVAARQVEAWLNTQGKPGQLVNSGDAAFENLSLLLGTLQGYEISSPRIQDAIDRIQNRPGRQLRRVPQPRRTEPVSTAAKADDSDSTNWLGRDMVKNADGSFRSKTPAEQRRDMEAAERAKAQPATPATHTETAWETLCNQLRDYGTHHSQRAAMRETYDRGIANGKSWREIYVEMNQLRKQYEFSRAPMAPSIKARSMQ